MASKGSKASQSQGLLLFHLNQSQLFALGTLKIRELVPFTALTKIPNSHPSIMGAATVRGGTIPVIDMAAAIGFRPIEQSELNKCFIIITDCQRMGIIFFQRIRCLSQ